MLERYHIKGIGESAKEEDLIQLFQKVGKIEDLYFPTNKTATGMRKDFAIVKVEVNSEKGYKMIKDLNGSIWKGSKIRVSKAKEFYKDKVVREKEEETKRESQETKDPKTQDAVRILRRRRRSNRILSTICRIEKNPFIKVRKARGIRSHKLCCKPILSIQGKTFIFLSIKKKFQVANNKLIFEDESFSFDNSKYEELSSSKSRLIELSIASTKFSSTNKSSSIASASTAITQPRQGKGVRRGFGTLVATDCCIEEDDSRFAALEINNEETSAEFIGETSQEELDAEKDRLLKMFQQITSKPVAIVEPKVPKKLAQKKETTAETATSSSNQGFSLASIFSENSNSSVSEGLETSNKAGFINMGEFKNIFAKSGGVWWNDEADSKENAADVRGESVENDIIFREAEKLGFDIRNSTMDELRNKSTNEAKRGFKLFGEDSTMNKNKVEEKNKFQEDHDKHTFRFGLDFIQLLLGAKQFTRERPLHVIKTEWARNRRVVLADFKKKRKDAIRRKQIAKKIKH